MSCLYIYIYLFTYFSRRRRVPPRATRLQDFEPGGARGQESGLKEPLEGYTTRGIVPGPIDSSKVPKNYRSYPLLLLVALY